MKKCFEKCINNKKFVKQNYILKRMYYDFIENVLYQKDAFVNMNNYIRVCKYASRPNRIQTSLIVNLIKLYLKHGSNALGFQLCLRHILN